MSEKESLKTEQDTTTAHGGEERTAPGARDDGGLKEALGGQALRSRAIVRTSVVGIIANVLLAAFKAAVGLLANSIAIILDAVNNLTDALSSVITIVGTKLAGKAPDYEHPYGYGRIEYLSAIVISVIVLYAGVTSFVESVKKIIEPEPADYTVVALVIVAVAVVAKLVLGRYVKGQGVKWSSDSLVASGTDATMDAVISASTLVAALIYLFAGISLEAWLGAVIAVVIIKAGIDMLRETLSKVLGRRVEADKAQAIKETISSVPGVYGAYDLVLNDYGPDTLEGSVHVEVDETSDARTISALSREIQRRVLALDGVFITAVGVYARPTADAEALKLEKELKELVFSHDHVVQLHGFSFNRETRQVVFDIIIDFEVDREALYAQIVSEVEQRFPDYRFTVVLDTDVSD